jgi:protein-disulfide isomerase
MQPTTFTPRGTLMLSTLLGTLCFSACQNDSGANELREQQRQILAKLNVLDEKIEKLAARASAPAAARPTGPDPARAYNLPAGTSPVKGPADAPITIVEFSDYQCPFCARSEPLVKEALAAYPTQARVVFKHFPLTSIHPNAMPAALAAAAAQQQGKFWEMHEKLFANQRALEPEQLKQ